MAERACCGDSCCPPSAEKPASVAAAALATLDAIEADATRVKVREGYGEIARTGGSCGSGGGCCGPTTLSADALATAIGYGMGDLTATPEGANLGLSCGNPTAIASLKPGEVVLDLGSGGGFDCFLAGPRVGATGRVIGVDMTPDMLTRARRNVAVYRERTGLDNVEFRLGEIENLPVADGSVDVVISNCVLNLSPEKSAVWREITRVLKLGGRVAVSDLSLLRPLPAAVKGDVEALIGCVAGAVTAEETRAMASGAGLVEIEMTAKAGYVEALVNSSDPLFVKIVRALPAGMGPGDYVTSLDVSARKPAGKAAGAVA